MNQKLRLPGEWERHDACWIAFPYLRGEWLGTLPHAQRVVAELCRAIAGPGREQVRLLVRDEALEDKARGLIGDAKGVDYVRAEYGDCWMRDIAPLLGHDDAGRLGALCFEFNGWGGKYVMPFDDRVSPWLTDRLDAERFQCPVTLEGGALESNGAGIWLTTESCVLNPNRNPELSRQTFERELEARVELEQLIWLDRGLEHDHTDGHVDMIARFVAPDAVICMRPDANAPNARVLASIRADLQSSGLTVLELPAPRAISAPDGSPLPASYCNFYVANEAVIVPTYDIPEDREALGELAAAFPKREVIGIDAKDLLWGGGAFHCVTQPQPSAP